MTLTINDVTMTSDQTARQARGRQHLWEVSWLPGRVLDRNSAITAMVLADQVGVHDLNERHRLWLHIEGWAAELGLTRSREHPNRRQRPAAARRSKTADGSTRRLLSDQPARPALPCSQQRGGAARPDCGQG